MTVLLESPWPALLLGAGLESALLVYLWRSGKVSVLAAMVLVAAVTAGLVVLERLVITDAEAVEDTLERARASLEANDAPAVLALFTTESPRRAEVQSILSHVTVREARIAGDMELAFDRPDQPQSVIVTFTARVEARDSRGQIPYENMIGRFRVTLRRSGDGWQIHDYAQSDLRTPGGGPSGSPGNRRPR